jgi:hypothetical protein
MARARGEVEKGRQALKITIETETPNDSASMFRVTLDDKPIGENLTAVQTDLIVYEILQRIVLTRPRDDHLRRPD